MDCNAEFLNYIYQNAEMGIEAIEVLLKNVEDQSTKELLNQQLGEYKTANVLAFKKLRQLGSAEKDSSAMKKIMSYMVISAKTLVDHSPAHIAEMMMQGSVMGIIDITKNLKKYRSADAEIVDLGNVLLKVEEDGFQQWRSHLSQSLA